MTTPTHATAADFEQRIVYVPEERPGYVAWVGLFPFGNGDIGLTFDEIRRKPNSRCIPPSIEFLEAGCFAFQFARTYLPASHPDLLQEVVTMKSSDGGRHWAEAHRHWGKAAFRVGYPDGRMIRVFNPAGHAHEFGADRHHTSVDETRDGGRTTTQIARFLPGFTFVPHRYKKLRDGSLLALGPVAPTWGPGGDRPTREATYPGEHQTHQAAFMASADQGHIWTGPHYVLPGIKAYEADFVELPDGRLLVINSSVQQGAAVRQIVRRLDKGFVCEPVRDIQKGAAEGDDVQSGIVPEAIDITPEGMIIGARRGDVYTCSNDLGETWHEISGAPRCGYQPQVLCLPDGRFMAAWHRGTDSSFGQQDMAIGIHTFRLQARLPHAARLSLRRLQSQDGTGFINAFAARLVVGSEPVAAKTIELRVKLTWRDDGRYNATPVEASKDVRTAVTDENGIATFTIDEFEGIPDAHHGYTVQANYRPAPEDRLAPCTSESFDIYNMASRRNTTHPHPVYFAENTLFLAKPTADEFGELIDLVKRIDRFDVDLTMEQWAAAMGDESRARQIVAFLLEHKALTQTDDGRYRWFRAVHCGPKVIEHVRVNDLVDSCV